MEHPVENGSACTLRRGVGCTQGSLVRCMMLSGVPYFKSSARVPSASVGRMHGVC